MKDVDSSLLASESVFVKIPDECSPNSPNYTDSIDELQDDLKSLSWDQLITLDLEEESVVKSPSSAKMYEKVKLTKDEAFSLLNMAATLLQRNIRRYFQQKKYQNFLVTYKSAVKIQSAWRGYRTRNLDMKVVRIKHNYMIQKLQERMCIMNENYKCKVDDANRDKSLLIQIVSFLSNELDKVKYLVNGNNNVRHEFNNLRCELPNSEREGSYFQPITSKDESEFYINNPHLTKSDSGINVSMMTSSTKFDRDGEISDLNDNCISDIFVKDSSLAHYEGNGNNNTVIHLDPVGSTTPTNVSINNNGKENTFFSSNIAEDIEINKVLCKETFHADPANNAMVLPGQTVHNDIGSHGGNSNEPTVNPNNRTFHSEDKSNDFNVLSSKSGEGCISSTADRSIHSPIRCTTPTNIFNNESRTELFADNVQRKNFINECKSCDSMSSSLLIEEYIENLLDHVVQNQIKHTTPKKFLKMTACDDIDGHCDNICDLISSNSSIDSLSLSRPTKEGNPIGAPGPIQCKTPTNMFLNHSLKSSRMDDEGDGNEHINFIGGNGYVNDVTPAHLSVETNGYGSCADGLEADSVEFMDDSLQTDDCKDTLEQFANDSLQMDSITSNPIQADSLQFLRDSLQS